MPPGHRRRIGENCADCDEHIPSLCRAITNLHPRPQIPLFAELRGAVRQSFRFDPLYTNRYRLEVARCRHGHFDLLKNAHVIAHF